MGETCLALVSTRGGADPRRRGARVSRTDNIQGVCHPIGRPAREAVKARRARHPSRLCARPRLRRTRRRPARLRHREEVAGRTSTASRRWCRHGTDLREVPRRTVAGRPPHLSDPSVPGSPAALGETRAASRRCQSPSSSGTSPPRRPHVRNRHRLLSARLLHDEAQPAVNERVVTFGFRDLHPLQEEDGAQGRSS